MGAAVGYREVTSPDGHTHLAVNASSQLHAGWGPSLLCTIVNCFTCIYLIGVSGGVSCLAAVCSDVIAGEVSGRSANSASASRVLVTVGAKTVVHAVATHY